MLTITLLKIVSDLAFYYTFAGTVAAVLGGRPAFLLACLAIQSLSLTLSFAASSRGKLRYLPLVLLILCFLLPGVGPAEALAAFPPAVYVVRLAAKQLYLPQWSRQVDIFSLYWKLLLGFLAAAALFGVFSAAASMAVPSAAVTLICSVLLMRSLRHDPEVYCQKSYQATELALVLLTAVCAWFLSTPAFLHACGAVMTAFYSRVIVPLLMACAYLAAGIVQVIWWVLSFIRLGFQAPEENSAPDLSSAAEILQLEGEAGSGSPLLGQILTALGIVAALTAVVLVFRYLSRRERSSPPEPRQGERRYTVEAQPAEAPAGARRSAVQRVRAQYRKYLRLCRDRGVCWEKSATSQEVAALSKNQVDPAAGEELRQLYLEARYHGQASREDAEKARQLVLELWRSAKNKIKV